MVAALRGMVGQVFGRAGQGAPARRNLGCDRGRARSLRQGKKLTSESELLAPAGPVPADPGSRAPKAKLTSVAGAVGMRGGAPWARASATARAKTEASAMSSA